MALTVIIIYWDTQYNTQMYEWQWWLIGDMFMFSYCLTEVHIAIAYCKALSYGLITFGLKHRWTSRFNNSAVIRSVVYITCLWELRGGNVIKGTMCCMAFARWFHCHVWFDLNGLSVSVAVISVLQLNRLVLMKINMGILIPVDCR